MKYEWHRCWKKECCLCRMTSGRPPYCQHRKANKEKAARKETTK